MHTSFEWDEEKDVKNRRKHGVGFETAQYAFIDPKRVIAEDITHSKEEKLLLYWVGERRCFNG